MIAGVDIGNSTINVFGIERTGALDYEVLFRIGFDSPSAQTESACLDIVKLNSQMRAHGADRPEGIIGCSVVPALTARVGKALESATGIAPVWVTKDCSLGFTLDVAEPGRIGADRLVDAAWACAKYPLPLVTVDAGTATTFNIIDAERRFRSGPICAGISTSLHALHTRTAQLPRVELCSPVSCIARTTEDSMLAGAVFGSAAMIDGLIDRVEHELAETVSAVITGGMSGLIVPLCARKLIWEPDMLAKGLGLIFDRMNKNRHW